SSITISWGSSTEALRFEVSGADRIWQDAGLNTSFTFDGLAIDSAYTFFVRGVFPNCIGPALEVSCSTLPCLTFPDLTGIANDVSCFGGNDGSIQLNTNGQFTSWDVFFEGSVLNGSQVTDLLAGTYQSIAIDSRGCADTLDLTIEEPAEIVIDITTQGNLSCNGQVSLIPIITGGNGPFSFLWNGSAVDSLLTGITMAGIYSLVVQDANGCEAMASLQLDESSSLQGELIITPESCSNMADGSIVVNLTGGTPDFTYTWSDPNIGSGNQANNLPSGSYFVTVTDANMCEIVLEATVEQGPDLELSGTTTGARCFGGSNGSVEVFVNNGVGNLSYNWSPNIPNDGSIAFDVPAGTYTVDVTDERGCSASREYVVTEPPILDGNGIVTDVLCHGEATGGIQLETTGGTPPYVFDWGDGVNQASPGPLTAGEYTVFIVDANGCSRTQSFTVTENAPLTSSVQVEDAKCAGENSGSISVTSISGGLPPYSYYWPSLDTSGAQLSDISSAIYEVQITDANGCVQIDSAVVNEPPNLLVEAVTEDVRCFGEQSGLIELSTLGGTPGYQYRLNSEGTWQGSNAFLGISAGSYVGYVQDGNGCVVEIP
ncbi:MAG: SprB repeat-containing protein, partial [Bacteroidota bacterium]